ncbi:hAT family C-terminal dimerization domain containing protein [Nitzschia inconspicua]|uniref:HAT family C-terminal dimerization domain containing protein n=1 Tax=Nitzschia inconspicua TaxID=303405 RepID=A0A9K3LL43_9STRA|nr:hAT family C-terminal dimerization domain containing protein [Nitzschia inconspicua]
MLMQQRSLSLQSRNTSARALSGTFFTVWKEPKLVSRTKISLSSGWKIATTDPSCVAMAVVTVWNWEKEDDFFADLEVDQARSRQQQKLIGGKKRLPTFMSSLAKAYLSIQATSAPSERVFSAASMLIEKRRNRLDPELAGKMLFVAQNWDLHEKHLQDMLLAAAEQQEGEEVQGS